MTWQWIIYACNLSCSFFLFCSTCISYSDLWFMITRHHIWITMKTRCLAKECLLKKHSLPAYFSSAVFAKIRLLDCIPHCISLWLNIFLIYLHLIFPWRMLLHFSLETCAIFLEMKNLYAWGKFCTRYRYKSATVYFSLFVEVLIKSFCVIRIIKEIPIIIL